MTDAPNTCPHVEHRHDRATDRRIGLDPRVDEWQPCPEQLTLDTADPNGMADRSARLRAELDRLDTARLAARAESLTAVQLAAGAHAGAGRRLDEAVAEARAYGATWQQIADAVGLVRSAAWERWAHR